MPRGVSRYDEAALQGRLSARAGSLPNRVASWRATQGVTTTAAGKVTSWVDVIGGLNCPQATAGSQPNYLVNGRNGRPGVQFSGGQSLGPSAPGRLPIGLADHTVLMVGYLVGNGPQKMMIWGGNSASTTRTFGNRNGFYESGTNGSGNDATANTIPWAGNDLISICGMTPANKTTINRANGNPTSQLVTVSSVNISSGGAYIGSFGGTFEYMTGIVQQIDVFSGILTQQEQDRYFGEAAWEWNLVGLLHPSSPFKNRSPLIGD